MQKITKRKEKSEKRKAKSNKSYIKLKAKS